MANPQLEDGHTKIANDIMDALMRTNFSAYDRRILDCIFRKTYGWNKKSDRISYSQFEEATDIKRWHIARAIKRLVERQIIVIIGEGQILEYSIQKDFEKWQPLPKQVIDTITQTGNELLPKEVTVSPGKPLPIQVKPLPIQVKPLPIQVTKPLPKQVNTKAIKHLQKHITKAKNGTALQKEFEEFCVELKSQYTDLDFEHEIQKFQTYWSEDNRKLQRPKTALINWMDKARIFKERDKKNGTNQLERGAGKGESEPKKYDYRRGLGGPGAVIHRP